MLYYTFLGLLEGCLHDLVSQVHVVLFESKILHFKIYSVLRASTMNFTYVQETLQKHR